MTNKKYILTELTLIAGVLFSLLLMIFKNNIWFDESFTLNLVQHSWGEMIRLTALDVHPPLYYIAVKLFTEIFGWNHPAIYATSVLCFITLLAISGWFFGKYFSHKVALVVVAVLSMAPNMLKYALQLRMYSMAILWVTLAFYLAYILCGKIKQEGFRWNKYWFLLALVNVLAAYTHYFAGVAAVAISFYVLIYILLVKKEKKGWGALQWCLYCGLMGFLYLPWIPILFQQMSEVNNDYWISSITGGALLSYVKLCFAVPGTWVRLALVAVYLLGIVLLLLHFGKKQEDYRLLGCYIVVAIWFLFGIGYSVLRSPILVDRYVVIILPLLWIPIGVAYAKPFYKYLCAIALLVLVVGFVKNYKMIYEEYTGSFQNELVPYLSEQMSDDDVFFHLYVQDMSIGKAYFPDAEHYAFNWIGNGQVFHYWEDLTECHLIAEVRQMQGIKETIWCFNGDYVHLFAEEGWNVETIQLTSGVLYRIYH